MSFKPKDDVCGPSLIETVSVVLEKKTKIWKNYAENNNSTNDRR